jgi:hypothetical protein
MFAGKIAIISSARHSDAVRFVRRTNSPAAPANSAMPLRITSSAFIGKIGGMICAIAAGMIR